MGIKTINCNVNGDASYELGYQNDHYLKEEILNLPCLIFDVLNILFRIKRFVFFQQFVLVVFEAHGNSQIGGKKNYEINKTLLKSQV